MGTSVGLSMRIHASRRLGPVCISKHVGICTEMSLCRSESGGPEALAQAVVGGRGRVCGSERMCACARSPGSGHTQPLRMCMHAPACTLWFSTQVHTALMGTPLQA